MNKINSNYTGKFHRTLSEAFGPHTERTLWEYYDRPKAKPLRVVAIVITLAVVAFLLLPIPA